MDLVYRKKILKKRIIKYKENNEKLYKQLELKQYGDKLSFESSSSEYNREFIRDQSIIMGASCQNIIEDDNMFDDTEFRGIYNSAMQEVFLENKQQDNEQTVKKDDYKEQSISNFKNSDNMYDISDEEFEQLIQSNDNDQVEEDKKEAAQPTIIIKDVCNLCNNEDPYDFTCMIPDDTILNQVLSYLMLLITFISLGSQPISQLIKKTSKGLSAFTWQISIFAFWIQTLNMILSEPAKYFAFQNLKYETFIALIPHFNTFLCVIFCINTIHLYLIYYRKENKIDKHYKQQLLIFIAQLLFILISGAACFILTIKYGQCNSVIKVLAYITMILGCILSCIQVIPQIVTTYKAKTGGALSLLSQLAQPPANIYTFVLYFFQQLLVLSILQFILCILQVYYDVYLVRKNKKHQKSWEQIVQF